MSEAPRHSTPTPSAIDEEALVDQVVTFAGDKPAEEQGRLKKDLLRLLGEHGRDAVTHLVERLFTTGATFAYYPPEPLAKLIHYRVADVAVTQESALIDAKHLELASGRSCVFLSNHLSYSDANLFQILLARAGFAAIADRLTVVAGPKVYSDPLRRFSSLCFGSIKTPQSSARASEEAVMPAREVARLALETIEIARARQRAGDALLLFVEGTRSRAASMQRTLAAVARYLDDPDSLLVPIGVTGSERFVPVGEERVHPTRVTFRIGHAVPARVLSEACAGNRRLMMDAVGAAIARLLPAEYQGVYAPSETNVDPGLEEARRAADLAFGPV